MVHVALLNGLRSSLERYNPREDLRGHSHRNGRSPYSALPTFNCDGVADLHGAGHLLPFGVDLKAVGTICCAGTNPRANRAFSVRTPARTSSQRLSQNARGLVSCLWTHLSYKCHGRPGFCDLGAATHRFTPWARAWRSGGSQAKSISRVRHGNSLRQSCLSACARNLMSLMRSSAAVEHKRQTHHFHCHSRRQAVEQNEKSCSSIFQYILYQVSSTYYLLPTTYYLRPTTYYLLPTTYNLSVLQVPSHTERKAGIAWS